MTAIIFSALSYVLLYKYVALFIISYLAALLLPLPSNTSLLAAGAFASQGYLNVYLVLLVAFLANELGDLTGFFLSRRYGKEFLIKIGFRKMIESRKYVSLEKFIFENSKMTIYLTRFVGQIGPLVNILTGLSKEITFRKFLVFGIAGELTYTLALCLTGYFLGSAWQNLTLVFELISFILIILVVVFIFNKLYFRGIKS